MHRPMSLPLGAVVATCAALDALAVLVIAMAPQTIAVCGRGWLEAGIIIVIVYTLGLPLLTGAALGLAAAQIIVPLRRYDLWIGSAIALSIVAYVVVAGTSANVPVPSDPHGCAI